MAAGGELVGAAAQGAEEMFGGDSKKWEMLNDPRYTSASRLGLLFGRLRLTNGDEDGSDSDEDTSVT